RWLAALVGSLLLIFSLANLALQCVLTPSLPSTHLRHLRLPQEVTLDGWLFRGPDRFPHRGRLYLEALQLWHNAAAHPASGKILVSVRTLAGAWQYGDVLHLSLHLRAPRNFHTPGSFNYEGYLARQEIYLSAFLWDDSGVTRTGEYGNGIRTRIEHV